MLLYDKTTSVLILQSCHLLGAIVRAVGMHQYRLQSHAKGLQRPVRGFFMRAGLQGSAVAEECLEERNYCEDSSSTIFIERKSSAGVYPMCMLCQQASNEVHRFRGAVSSRLECLCLGRAICV